MQVSLDAKRLDIVFSICVVLLLVLSALMPQLRLNFFAPFIIIAAYRKSLLTCLWLAFLCGIILDLLSSHIHFGLYPLDFCLAIMVLYPQRRNFFADNLSTLPIMTFFFSLFSTLIMAVLMYSIEMRNSFSVAWMLSDLFVMPAMDAVYAFICFTLPALIFGKSRRRTKDYFN